MAKRVPTHSRITEVKLSDLIVDIRVQRALKPAWVKSRTLDWNAFGIPVINIREDGTKSLLDAQHRVELARKDGFGDSLVKVEAFTGLSLADEARVFRFRNDMTKVRRIDDFRIAVVAEEPKESDIDRIVRAHGFVVTDSGTHVGGIAAVAALDAIYSGGKIADQEAGAVALARTLEVLKEAWGTERDAYQGYILEGIGLVLLAYPEIDRSKLVRTLVKLGGPQKLLHLGSQSKDLHGKSWPPNIASAFVLKFNAARGEKVESWW